MTMQRTGKRLSRWLHNLSYRRKIFLITSSVSLLPIMILGFFAYGQSRELLYTTKNKDIDYYFTRASQSLMDEMNICEDVIWGMEHEPQFEIIFQRDEGNSLETVQDVFRQKLAPYVYNIKKYNSVIREITFYSKLDTPPYQSLLRDYNEQIFPEELNLTKDDFNWYYNGRSIVVTRMIYDNSDQLHIGNLSILINPKDFIFKTASPEFFNYSVVLFAPDGECAYQHLLYQDKENLLPIQFSSTEKERITKNGVRYLVKSVSVGNGWTLCAYVNEKSITSGNETILATTFAIVLVCLFLVIISGVLFSLTFTKRIASLNDSISEVSQGNFDKIIHSEYTDEIGILTNRFGEMTSKIDELIQNVYKSQIIQQKAELKALQAQIKPHFLYNTLQAVNWNAITHGDLETSRIVVNLSNFYRLILNRGEDDISVEDELMIVKCYINIEENVYHNFKVNYEIDKSLYPYKIIPLLLQPLVENAIKHGIRESDVKSGEIRITVKQQDNDLLFSVSDNGRGITEPDEMILNHSSHGYGLKNVNARIKLRFGEMYGISVESRCNPTTFIIRLPLIHPDNPDKKYSQ